MGEKLFVWEREWEGIGKLQVWPIWGTWNWKVQEKLGKYETR